jgi:hypothetical protein
MVQLGTLQSVPIREIWRDEAKDFDSWLAKPENLAALSQALGFDLELEGRQVDVGDFRVDLLAKDNLTGSRVIIENQLDSTNHDHLGKILTYAAGLDASHLIWLVGTVREEHRSAIDWLNNHLDDEVSCFLIRIEVWTIDGTSKAAKFEVVSHKNSWKKAFQGSINDDSLSETKLRQLDFWNKIVPQVQKLGTDFKIDRPYPRHWCNVKLAGSLCHMTMTLNTIHSGLATALYIRDEFEFYEFLKENEEAIRNCMGKELHWFQANKASGFRIKQVVNDPLDESKFDDFAEWYANQLVQIRTCVTPYVNEYRSA